MYQRKQLTVWIERTRESQYVIASNYDFFSILESPNNVWSTIETIPWITDSLEITIQYIWCIIEHCKVDALQSVSVVTSRYKSHLLDLSNGLT